MGEQEVITTDVDKLMDLLRTIPEITISEAAKKLNMPRKIVETLADLLEEEGLIHVRYQFTTPYISLGPVEKEKEQLESFDSRNEFYDKARAKGLPDEKIEVFWRKYVDTNSDSIKYAFYEKAKVKGLPVERIDILWDKYYKKLRG
jgi:DNA-binding transcriptional ArsR family regulator